MQCFLGNGIIGALVGGTNSQEIVPVSISGLYFSRRRPSGKKSESIPRTNHFKASREALLKGNFEEAKINIEKLVDWDDLGTFQYVADLIFQFSLYGLESRIERSGPISSVNIATESKKQAPSIKFSTGPQNTPSRIELLESLKGKLKEKDIFEFHNSRNKSAYPTSLISETVLDLRNGVASSVFVDMTSPSTASSDSILYFSNRDWFASAIDGVIVSDVKCSSYIISENDSFSGSLDQGCVNVALQINRSNSPNLPVDISVDTKYFQAKFDSYPLEHVKSMSFDLSFGSNSNVIVPSTHLCGIIICVKNLDDESSNFRLEVMGGTISDLEQSAIMLCNGAGRFQTVFSISMNQDNLNLVNNSESYRDINRMKCWSKLSPALDFGVKELRARHEADFSKRMAVTELIVQESKSREVTISQLFQYSRYLMLSSSRSSVMNLQGIWADGPTSSWNGDYHLNINLEQGTAPITV
jgi:hypothetical protein